MKYAVTISGGYDSAAAYIKWSDKKECDFIFFNYGQKYYENELKCALSFANFFKKQLIIINLNLGHNCERRNFHFISKLKLLNYDVVIMGNRNILPIMDKYKDSNLLNIKLYSYLMNIKVILPIIGYTKRKIIKILKLYNLNFYNCYLNKDDYKKCSCINCIELKKVLK